jgi:hypothetical protein
MVTFVSTTNKREKTIYTEVDATPYYALSDEDGKLLKRKPFKTPSHFKTTAPASLEDTS